MGCQRLLSRPQGGVFQARHRPRKECIEHSAPEPYYEPGGEDSTSWDKDPGREVDRLGKKIGKVLGKIFRF